jgi:hypothetical protein
MSGELRVGGSEQAVRIVHYATTTLVLTEEPPPGDGGAS